jgi:hypothetical protein
MNKLITSLFLFCTAFTFAQKDSLTIGDRYAEDQIYAMVTYNQMYDQPMSITRSGFSYGLSTGFMKDVILNKQGTFSFALGAGYGFDFYNHELKVEEINGTALFTVDNTLTSNTFFSHNLEFPFEIRWRTSTANKYKFWRIYTGIKLVYNFSNRFEFLDESDTKKNYSNISSYNKLQYGLTFSAGYDVINFHVFYGLSPLYKDAVIGNEKINTKVLKFGLVFYFL